MTFCKMWFFVVVTFTIFSCLGVPSLGPIEAMALPNTVHKLPDIYWNTSNPIFRIDNTDHIIDVNRNGPTGSEYDQVNIVCPLYDPRTTPSEADTEKFVIYHVKKEEYETCQIMSAHPRILAQCDKPYSLRYFTISFRPFSPTPGALEFHPGKDYYFISTSSKTDLHRRVDGMCRSNNMRIVFKVADRQQAQKKETSSPVTTTTTLTSTTEILYTFEDSVSVDNAIEFNSVVDPAIEESEVVDTDKVKKKKRKNKKKKQKKDKTNTNINKTDMEEDELEASYKSTNLDEDLLMNDKPPNQIRQREPSLVEKVNNLMKQEASIGISSAMTIIRLSLSQTLLISIVFTFVTQSSLS